ncbi:diaminopimelate epimerase [Staphylospora marina]|uniref:diaminopimelate epimerase n=1 Tax=Staphylospora marina TaxID=2490858 RepID=UPI000F5C0D52|nr:diaminopimelate epimerase [Staphylospora marina]
MKFTKMHGLGNDFVVVRTERTPDPREAGKWAVRLCDRHTGIGADGLVVIAPSQTADVAMRIFNSDGSEAEQCGNAVRCVARYAAERIVGLKECLTVETRVGPQTVWTETKDGRVRRIRVDMGEPVLEPARIPVRMEGARAVEREIAVGDRTFFFTAVSMGNPHMVIEVEDAVSFPVDTWGPLLETHEWFPARTNVEFVTFHSPEEVTMRVWERGVGQTMACGSGACAVVVAGVLTGRSRRRALVHLKGGDLWIEWNERDGHVYMTGPAEFVFEGEWPGPGL